METIYTSDRKEWRAWLSGHFETSREIWLIYPMKGSGEESILYNDAVEEALCFGWIDSIVKHTDPLHRAQRFSPRRKNSPYSRLNIERLIWLDERNMIHPSVRPSVLPLITEPFEYPEDIMEIIEGDMKACENFRSFTPSYKRIRIAYIDAARNRPEEFNRRLNNFMDKTRQGKIITGYGGTEKYYSRPH